MEATKTKDGGTNGCRGTLAIMYRNANDPSSEEKTKRYYPDKYKNTRKLFRGKAITRVEVWGNCPWRLFPMTNFKGRFIELTGGFASSINFVPKSISQSAP